MIVAVEMVVDVKRIAALVIVVLEMVVAVEMIVDVGITVGVERIAALDVMAVDILIASCLLPPQMHMY